ncbi:MAG TPA: single-stranded-DNA-specific exonuclease RecJ [Bacteroidota bacterium]|nr:single-stranded-DNA-specific exonuclease RecJ [Bacteroidota bacterium]
MTKRQYRWTLSPEPDEALIGQLSKEINISETLAKVLVSRRITTYEQAKEFFRPQFANLHDPFLMDGMEAAVQRVFKAIEHKERIMVFGDYDVDGTNSAAMLTLFFRHNGLDTTFYIPDRIKEGYGISNLAISRAQELGVTLLISIDCGITAVNQVDYARTMKIDVIICDHHEPGEQIPDAIAVLDPLKPNCHYPFKNLCGCGVGFKLIEAIALRQGKEETAYQYIDFVTLATTADIVPLVGENRVITKIGLEQINKSPRPGIRALIQSSGAQATKINTGQIVFILAPRINAVGRMGDAGRAVNLLINEDPESADQMAQVLEDENRNRRKIDEDTFFEAQHLAEELMIGDNNPAIVLHHEHWHPGVIGIVASRLVEKYYRPTIMLTTVDGVAKGSARSIVGFDIHNALKRVEHKLLQFGGHKYAAGLSVALDKVDEFRQEFNIVVEQLMSEEIRTPEIKIDAGISLNELTPRFLRILKEFAPFGPGNMRPIFLAKHVELVGTPKIVGKDHLRLKVRQGNNVFDSIGFGLGALMPEVVANPKGLDIVFSVDEHQWQPRNSEPVQGDPFPQLKVKDIRKSIHEE